MPKQRLAPFWHLPVAAISLLIVYLGVLVASPEGYVGGHLVGNTPPASLRMDTGKRQYDLTVVRTQEEQNRGLSGITEIRKESGMLFDNPSEGNRCIWMKDMLIPIDILWLDSDKQIVRLEQDVSPETYPETFCARAQYVVELAAGEAARNGLRIGSSLRF